MIYCMSDIHGECDRYKAMLEFIQFSDSDTLYVLGDVIDRKPGGIDILMDTMPLFSRDINTIFSVRLFRLCVTFCPVD